jgi:hypothetical protein
MSDRGLTSTPSQADGPAKIELAKVTSVNAREYSVDLMTIYTHKPLVDVPFATPYASSEHAGGINVMPEVGSHCYVVVSADKTCFILGFVVNPRSGSIVALEGDSQEEAPSAEASISYMGNRPPLEPGDVMLATRDRNFIIMRTGGLLEIGATSMAQRVYIPIQNTIKDYFQRYEAHSPLGEIIWGHPTLKVGEKITGSTDSTPALISYSFKNTAQEDVSDGKYTLELRMGNVTKDTLDLEKDNEHIFANEDLRKEKSSIPTTGDDGVLSFTIYSHNTKKVTYAYQLDREGNNFVKSTGNIHVELDGDFYTRIIGNAKIEFGAGGSTVDLTSGGDLEAIVEDFVVAAASKILLGSSSITLDNQLGNLSIENSALVTIAAGQIVLGATGVGGGAGGGPSFPVVKDNGLLNAVAAHTHGVTLIIPQPLCAAIVANAVLGMPGVVVPAFTTPSPALAIAPAAVSLGTKTK